MKEYQDHYHRFDVLLVADVYKNFLNSTICDHILDPLHFVILPFLAWTMALRHTDVFHHWSPNAFDDRVEWEAASQPSPRDMPRLTIVMSKGTIPPNRHAASHIWMQITGVEYSYSMPVNSFVHAVGLPLEMVSFPIDIEAQVIGTRVVSILCTNKVV